MVPVIPRTHPRLHAELQSHAWCHAARASRLQVVAPCLLTMEGTLLGAQAFPWVGARTIAGAAGSGLVLWASHHNGWGLTGGQASAAPHPAGPMLTSASDRQSCCPWGCSLEPSRSIPCGADLWLPACHMARALVVPC